MHMHVQDFFWALHLIALPVFCLKIKNIETRTAQLFLGKDGELLDSSGIPNCGPGNKIILKSYTYNRMKCTSASCESVHEEQLSPSTSLQLHQNCSFRPTCEALKFPVLKRLRAPPSELHAVTIKYQCIDDQSSVLNMCEKHKMNFSDTLHLTFKYYTQNLKNCECWVNQGAFSLTIMDLRLKSRNKDACSAAKFLINGHHFTCDPESGSYGAVFGELIQDDMPLGAFISLVPNSDTALPEMVWIQLTPEVSSQIDCHGDRISSEDTYNLNTMNTSQGIPTNSVTNGVHTTDNSHPILTTAGIEMSTTSPLDDNNARFWIVISVLLLLLGLVIGLLVILWRKHVRLKRHIRTQGEPRKEAALTVNTIYDQPNTVPRSVNKSLLSVSSTASGSSDTTEPQDDPAEGTLTRSEKNLVDGTRLRLKKIDNIRPCQSLSNIKSALESPSQTSAKQKSLNYLDQTEGTQRQQLSVKIHSMERQKNDHSDAKRFPQGLRWSLFRFSPVTTANTPCTSKIYLCPSTSSASDVSANLNVANLAKNTMADIESETVLPKNERSKLLKDTDAEFSVTKRKMFRH